MVTKKWTRPLRVIATALWLCLALPALAACPPGTCCRDQPGSGWPECGVGNPIDVITGNKFQREADMPALPGVLGLELVRHYNSDSAYANERGILGRDWRLSYDEEIVLAGSSRLLLILGDGSRKQFSKGLIQPRPGVTVYVPDEPGLAPIESEEVRAATEYSTRLGDKLHVFDSKGRLVRIEAPTGEVLTIQRNRAGWVQHVTDPQGRVLSIHYASSPGDRLQSPYQGVASIDTPLGRYHYSYGHPPVPGSRLPAAQLLANLVRVTYPPAPAAVAPAGFVQGLWALPAAIAPGKASVAAPISRLYHHEDPANPWLLTGMSVQGQGSDGRPMDERIVSWAYDARGRARLSVRGPYDPAKPGPEQLTLVFQPRGPDGSGETVLTNSLGQVTRYRYLPVQGRFRLAEVLGPGCAACGATNFRHRYDPKGQLAEVIQLDPQGRPLSSERMTYDAQQRVIRVDEVRFVDGKPAQAKMVVRYQYGPDLMDPQPSLIARPSVVPGREHIVRLQYNSKSQLAEVTETGFSPLGPDGTPAAAGTAITRSTRFDYRIVNRRSVLVGIDGPLPNGPKGMPEDSDVTRFDWDADASFVRNVVMPMGRQIAVSRDAAGRIGSLTLEDTSVIRFTHGFGGELQAVERDKDGTPLERNEFRHDALLRLTEEVDSVNGQELARRRQAYDAAGRLLWQADARGRLRQARYDTEGRIGAVAVTVGRMREEERYSYDEAGRLHKVEDSTGGIRQLVRDGSGHLIASIDPLGRWTRFRPGDQTLSVIRAANTDKPLAASYRFDPLGHLAESVFRGEDGMGRTREVVHKRHVDDFGREVLVESPDAGRELRRFDESDHLVQVVMADGSSVAFGHDAAGRLSERTVQPAPGASDAADVVRYTYVGERLTRIEDAQQVEAFSHDGAGRLETRRVSLKLNRGGTRDTLTRYRYDGKGRIAGQTLPDGSELQFERNAQGQIVALHRQWTSWAPWGLGRTTLARGLERDLVQLARLTYGNGIEAQWVRSQGGLLSRIVYRRPEAESLRVRSASDALVPAAHAAVVAPQLAVSPAASSAASRPAVAVPVAFAEPADPRALWDGRYLFDGGGNILVQGQFATRPAGGQSRTLFMYDAHDQLAQATLHRPGPDGSLPGKPEALWRYHSDSLGNRLLAQQGKPGEATTEALAYEAGSNRRAGTTEAAGRPGHIDDRALRWDSQGRLQSVTWKGAVTRYRYNREGLRVASEGATSRHYLYDEARHRLAELDDDGRLLRQYVWAGDQLLAVLDGELALAQPGGLAARAWHALRLAWSGASGSVDLKYVHLDHLGTPVAMTDSLARTVWQSAPAPFGARGASGKPAGEHLELRGPGQWEDAESGLFYNDQRYYDPQSGRYLSPDPLGLQGGVNAFSYAGNNPVVNGDPLGLVLMAFDGTGNTKDEDWLRSHGSSLSNVRQFQDLYGSGVARYVSGVGTVHEDKKYGDIRPVDYTAGKVLSYLPGATPEDADLAANYSGAARIERMMQYFNDQSDMSPDDMALPVDIVGFSRGAAEARDFANRITALTKNGYYRYTRITDNTVHCQKLSFRFMGLFDTVLSTNRSGTSYKLAIPDAFAYVAQAVALNEYRGTWRHTPHDSYGAFPLESILASPTSSGAPAGSIRIEKGFIGAHADIGGGFGEGENQLAQVPLAWMVDQARQAGLTMRDSAEILALDPVLHDKSDSGIRGSGAPARLAEDREVRYGNGSTTTQRQMSFLSGMSHADSLEFVQYFRRGTSPDWPGHSELYQTGTVDMRRYIEWLDCHGYHIREDARKCSTFM